MNTCVFCQIIEGSAPASKVYEDDRVMAFMDIFPIKEGHVLVIPKKHCQYLEELSLANRNHLLNVAQGVLQAQKQIGLHCDGNNFLVNDGKAANQHVPHVHVHVLPRQKGDVPKLVFSALTRMLNIFGKEKKRQRLEKLAGELSRVIVIEYE